MPVETPLVAPDGDGAETVAPTEPVAPPPLTTAADGAEAAVTPQQMMAADGAEAVVTPQQMMAADGAEAAVTPQQMMAADDAPENAGAPAPAVLPPPPEQTVVSDNSKEGETQIPPCNSDEQQKPKDVDDLSDDLPTRNSSDQSFSSDDEEYYYENPLDCWHVRDPYLFMHGGNRRYCRCPFSCNSRRNHWNDGLTYGFVNPRDPMASLCNDDWSRWPSSEPDHRNKRHNLASQWPPLESDCGKKSQWSSLEPDCGQKRYTVGAGLSNPHFWTCFINCILQCMVHTVPLVLKLQKADHPDPCPRAYGFCCYCSLKLHTNECIRLSGSSFYPKSFVNCLKSISSDFDIGVQQDAQEFLRCLLEKLDEASIAPSTSEEPSSTEESSIAKEIFGGCLKSELRCPECNHCSDKSEPFLDLSLELNMVDTLLDALQSFTKIELIEDFVCDGCKSRVKMEKQLKVEQAPEVLVIHLKRFTNHGVKIWDKLKYPLELDISSFMSSSNDAVQKYDLYAIVEHRGTGTYGRGHYVSYIRSSEDDWYELNDEKVCHYSEAQVLETTAYLLFYVKQGSPWFATLLEKEDNSLVDVDGLVSLAEQDTSLGTQELSTHEVSFDHIVTAEELSLTRSGDKNEHADRLLETISNKKDVSSRGSKDMEEMEPITHGSSEVDRVVTQRGSPPRKNENNSLLQLSHNYEDDSHRRNASLQDELEDCCAAPSMGMCTPEGGRVESRSNHVLGDGDKGTSKGKCK
ncbi:hypothetical protein BS78_01G276100 [Paspalum vaginatum]|nr:hypothetical protein BS78_01G276100 [Paspalum vaginatum]